MQQSRIPNTELDVSALCLGAGAFGTAVRGEEADRLLAAFIEVGGNFFDTAHCYAFWEPNGLGASERELAASLRRLGCLEQAVIATKGGHPDGGEDYRRPNDFLSEAVLQSDISESLERLGVERIDLYFLHRDDGVTPVGEIIERLNREIEAGRIQYIGASNWSVSRIAEANTYAAEHGLQGFVASQIQGSLALPTWEIEPDPTTRYITEAELDWHAKNSVPIVAYSATASGYFSKPERASPLYNNPDNEKRHERANILSRELGCTPTQVALAYLLHLSAPVIPLFSTNNPVHLQEALGATEIHLTAEHVLWLHDG